jgi:hypothetical protein
LAVLLLCCAATFVAGDPASVPVSTFALPLHNAAAGNTVMRVWQVQLSGQLPKRANNSCDEGGRVREYWAGESTAAAAVAEAPAAGLCLGSFGQNSLSGSSSDDNGKTEYNYAYGTTLFAPLDRSTLTKLLVQIRVTCGSAKALVPASLTAPVEMSKQSVMSGSVNVTTSTFAMHLKTSSACGNSGDSRTVIVVLGVLAIVGCAVAAFCVVRSNKPQKTADETDKVYINTMYTKMSCT